jgi:hypothetical protein
MVKLICTDRGQPPVRDIVQMVDYTRWPVEGSPGRWQVVWRDARVRPRRKAFWQPLLPLDPKYDTGLEAGLSPDLIEAEVWVFRCPACTRRPRWPRHRLDALCDGAIAVGRTELDLSLLE